MNKFIPIINLNNIDIPSGGLLYPLNWSIKYTPLTFGEVSKYSQSIFKSLKDKYEFLLDKIDANFDKLDLTLSDFLYISLLINLRTFNAYKFSLNYSCKECNTINSAILNTEDIEFKDLDKDNLIYDVKTASGIELSFSPLTVRDYFKLIELDKNEDVNYLFAYQCRNCDNLDELAEYIENPFLQDTIEFDKIDKAFYHSAVPIMHKCKNCNFETKLSIEGGMETLVSPFCEHTGIIKN
jgi:hypothetical protein